MKYGGGMNELPYPSDLTAAQWALIEPAERGIVLAHTTILRWVESGRFRGVIRFKTVGLRLDKGEHFKPGAS